VPKRAAMPCRMSSDPDCDSNGHLGPFCRSRSPAGPVQCSEHLLPSPTDASLSEQQTWPGARDSGPASSPAAADCEAQSCRQLLPASPTPVAVRGRRACRNDGHGHIERRAAAERDIAHRRRPETAPTATSSKPPNTGHGSQAVMKVQSSDGIGDPEGSGVGAPGPSLIWRSGFLAQSRRSGPAPCR
jgi:hypothetical protein